MTATDFLSIWGALLSTIAVTWSILRGIDDRGKIKLTGYIGYKGSRPGEKLLVLTIVNTGKRPITITGWGGHEPQNEKKGVYHFLLGETLPKTLGQGEYTIETTTELFSCLEQLDFLYVVDSTQKTWKMKKKYFNNISNDHIKH